MADAFLIVSIVVALLILGIVGFYVLVKYQHPEDANEAWFPKVVVWSGFVVAGATVLLLPLDVANNEGYPGETLAEWVALLFFAGVEALGIRLEQNNVDWYFGGRLDSLCPGLLASTFPWLRVPFTNELHSSSTHHPSLLLVTIFRM